MPAMTDHSEAFPTGPTRLLVDLAQGRLEPAEVDMLERVLRADGLTPPPPWIQRRAERIAGQRLQPRRTNPARRLVAALAFDTRLQPQFVGLRAAATHVRRLLFQAENIEVDLEMAPSSTSNEIRLAGQVAARGADPSGGILRLSTVDREWQAELDDSGEFWIENLVPGAYRLEILFRDRVVEVPVLPI